MTDINERSLQMVAHYLCNALDIQMAADDLILFIGGDETNNNGEAIREWVSAQDRVPAASRREMAEQLRDRLRDTLLEIELALRAAS